MNAAEQLIEQGRLDGGRCVRGRAGLDELIAELQKRVPGARARLAEGRVLLVLTFAGAALPPASR